MINLNRSPIMFLALALLVACGGSPAAPTPISARAPTAAAPSLPAPTAVPAPTSAPTIAATAMPAPSHYPVTITTCEGTETFTEAPRKVFVDYQPQVELLLRLGLGDRIAAYAGVGEVPIAADVADAFAKQVAPKTRYERFPTKEVALTAGYDLVIMAFPEYVLDPSQGQATRQEWQQAGTKVYDSKADCIGAGARGKTLEASFTQIRDLGMIFNVSDRAEALIASMQAKLAAVAASVAGKPRPKIAILDYIDDKGVPYFYAAGLYTDLIERAGGENVFADQPKQYTEISKEVVATRPVDVLAVMQWEGTISAAEKAAFYFKTFPNAPVSTSRRFVVLTNMDLNAGSGNADAVEKLARGLHPDAFSDIPAAPAGASYPVTIENCGRTLTFDKSPERVVVAYDSMAELLVALGLGDKIVGVQYGKAQEPLPEFAAVMNRLPYLAEPGKGAASKEVLISTRPDFVLVTYFTYDLDPSNGAASAADYQAAGAQAYGMGTDAPCLPTGTQPSMQTIYADIRNLGAIFGVPERAEALIGQMQGRIDAVQQKIAGLPPVKAIYYEDGTGPFTIYGDGLATEILTLAGGENVLKDQPAYTQVGQEVIAATNAEYWVITEYPGFAPTAERAKMLYTTFPNLPASQNKRSIGINGAEAGVGIRLPGVIETLARALHPEAFK